ncbi:hypothetical protein PBRA_000445, partial [Plasmodiophora brassicae]
MLRTFLLLALADAALGETGQITFYPSDTGAPSCGVSAPTGFVTAAMPPPAQCGACFKVTVTQASEANPVTAAGGSVNIIVVDTCEGGACKTFDLMMGDGNSGGVQTIEYTPIPCTPGATGPGSTSGANGTAPVQPVADKNSTSPGVQVTTAGSGSGSYLGSFSSPGGVSSSGSDSSSSSGSQGDESSSVSSSDDSS